MFGKQSGNISNICLSLLFVYRRCLFSSWLESSFSEQFTGILGEIKCYDHHSACLKFFCKSVIILCGQGLCCAFCVFASISCCLRKTSFLSFIIFDAFRGVQLPLSMLLLFLTLCKTTVSRNAEIIKSLLKFQPALFFLRLHSLDADLGISSVVFDPTSSGLRGPAGFHSTQWIQKWVTCGTAGECS